MSRGIADKLCIYRANVEVFGDLLPPSLKIDFSMAVDNLVSAYEKELQATAIAQTHHHLTVREISKACSADVAKDNT